MLISFPKQFVYAINGRIKIYCVHFILTIEYSVYIQSTYSVIYAGGNGVTVMLYEGFLSK
jgi:hypothetical protein